MSSQETFYPVPVGRKSSFPIYFGKKFYYCLVPSKDYDQKRSKPLMEDYNLTDISTSLVVCYTPNEKTRLFAIFSSYVEFFEYLQNFQLEQRCFYEVIFGEFPQKPHFDIDVSDIENLDEVAELLRESVIKGCLEVAPEISIERDVLIYSSHSVKKRSFHIVIANKCHDDNKQSQAFYQAVMEKVNRYTEGKWANHVDPKVYSPRQQFRIVGNQKAGSGRVKAFYENFSLEGKVYEHIYSEDVSDPNVKKLVLLCESLIGFTSGCKFLPSLINKELNKKVFGEFEEISYSTAQRCLVMLKSKMNPCPFTIKEIKGGLICLKRHGPSPCPICTKSRPHENENPYMLVGNGKIYWDCRRSIQGKRFFVGYLEHQPDTEAPENSTSQEECRQETFPCSGKFNFLPEGVPINYQGTLLEEDTSSVEQLTLMTDVRSKTLSLASDIAKKKSKDPGDLSGIVSFSGLFF